MMSTLKQIKLLVVLVLLTQSWHINAQKAKNKTKETAKSKSDFIKPDVRTWVLTDHFTLSDTVAVDTLSTGYQNYNPINQKSISSNYLGNYGSPYISNVFQDRDEYYGFMFYNTLLAYIPQPENLNFYNTKTPYINLTYHFGGPKRRSEEGIKTLFTQNINKYWNIGASYNLHSSIGQYEAQKAENQNFKFWTSYNGINYNLHIGFLYAKIKNYENGGVNLGNIPENEINFDTPEEIPVHFQDAINIVRSRKLFLNQSLGIVHISKINSDSIAYKIPVTTLFHSMNLEEGIRSYTIDNLPSYYSSKTSTPYYPNTYRDTLQTKDSTIHYSINNTFQIKFNEEANQFLKFGLRAYIENDVKFYNYQRAPEKQLQKKDYPYSNNNDTTLITSAIGGQIFKNLGNNFWWNAGAKLYFQGYRAGDSEITGHLNSSFRLFKDTAGFFANGGIYLQEPEFFKNYYFSNHRKWDNSFKKEKTIKIHGGFRIPTKRFELSGGTHLLNDYIYWNSTGTPTQSSDVLQVYYANINQHFIIFNRIHSHHQLTYQLSSNQVIIPLPDLCYYNSTYYENTLSKVLHFQIGFDFRFHTKYYAQLYDPASAQFISQNIEKIGNYPMADVFVNFLLKRARVYVKLDNISQDYSKQQFYNSIYYPANPSTIKFGVSWNFYD